MTIKYFSYIYKRKQLNPLKPIKMNTLKVTAAIQANKEISKNMQNINLEVDQFISAAKTYISAIKSGRMLCVIKSVSSSGMSRVLSFHSFEGNASRGYYRQYWSLFKALGYTDSKDRDGFRVNGCGMDMVFHTNYSIIHTLHNLGFINKKECDVLAQQTPVKL